MLHQWQQTWFQIAVTALYYVVQENTRSSVSGLTGKKKNKQQNNNTTQTCTGANLNAHAYTQKALISWNLLIYKNRALTEQALVTWWGQQSALMHSY